MTILIDDFPGHPCGLGVTLNWVVWRMYRLHPQKTRVQITKGNNPYLEMDRGANVWDYYFEQPEITGPTSRDPMLETPALPFSGHRNWNPQAVEALRPISSQIKLRPEIQARVDEFKEKHFKGRVLGIHLRGTDKVEEYQPMRDDQTMAVVERMIKTHSPDTVFLQTDDIRYWQIMQRFNPVGIAMPRSNKSLHHNPPVTRYEAGLMAVIDGFLGAACDHYAYTPSNFATISIIMGRHRTIDLINKHCKIEQLPEIKCSSPS